MSASRGWSIHNLPLHRKPPPWNRDLDFVLARLEASLHEVTTQASSQLEGDIAAARVHELHQLLPGLTRGEGVLASTFDHYQPIRGETPTRPRTDRDPRNRGEYLRQVLPGYD